MAELLSPERIAEIKQRAEKAAELRGAAVDIDQCYKDRAALVTHIAAQGARHESDVAVLQEIGRGVEADQAKIAALQAELDAARDHVRVHEPSLQRIGESHTHMTEAAMRENSVARHRVYTQGSEEQCYLCALIAKVERAETSLADAREKLTRQGQLLAHIHLHLTNDDNFDADELVADIKACDEGWINTENLLADSRRGVETLSRELADAREKLAHSAGAVKLLEDWIAKPGNFRNAAWWADWNERLNDWIARQRQRQTSGGDRGKDTEG